MKTATAKASWLDETGVRLDASYHLSEGRQAKIQVEQAPLGTELIADVAERVFYGGRAKRYYVDSPEKGVPFMGSSDMLKADLSSIKYVSTKHTRDLTDGLLQPGWTLISRSGTIGNTAYTTADYEGKIASEHVIRVIPNERILSGYLFAFLSSRYGYGLLTQGTFGAVIQHIEPDYVNSIPVPRLPAAQMQQIHANIEQAAGLREKANRALNDAVELLENLLPQLVFTNHYVTPVSAFKQRLRIDATIQQAAYGRYLEEATKSATLKKIASVSAQVFTPGIFKRIRVAAKNGVVFLSGTNLLENRPALTSFLSRRTHRLNDYILEEGWLAIQDSGSLSSMGYVSIVPEFLAGAAATNNLVRVIPGEINYNPYFFAYLKTKQGQQILKSLSYGTGQLHIDHGQIAQLEVPVYQDIFNKVTELVSNYTSQFNEAYKLETQAIHTVETAISAWQK